jgi:Cu(I)/Ag(I) efflux system membrane fusion protein
MKRIVFYILLFVSAAFVACKSKSDAHAGHTMPDSAKLYTCPMPQDSVFSDKPGVCPKCGMELVKVQEADHAHGTDTKTMYTCPMPQDSVFSDKPGDCPKCGMALVKTETVAAAHDHTGDVYTCPMHPDVKSDKPGSCPICGMNLVKKEAEGSKQEVVELDALLKPTNEFVVSSMPVTVMQQRQEQIEIKALGTIAYDTRMVGTISSRVSGRIEKLYVRYRFQKIRKGERIMDIYSPELLTAQQNLLFLLKNDPSNKNFIEAAKEKLLLLGMDPKQLEQVIQKGQATLTVAVYSQYGGHIHEAGNAGNMTPEPGAMKDISLLTEELSLKEGMYVQKGRSMFTVYDPSRVWALLNIYGENQGLVKTGTSVTLVPETQPGKSFSASIDYLEPFFRKGSKTLSARVYFNNADRKIPVGSQVTATIYSNTRQVYWLPKEAVLSLGLDRVVFEKVKGGFKAHKISTGIIHNEHIQVLSGLTARDSVAANAQYLMDSESFIKIKN